MVIVSTTKQLCCNYNNHNISINCFKSGFNLLLISLPNLLFMSLFIVCLKHVPSLFIANFSPLTASYWSWSWQRGSNMYFIIYFICQVTSYAKWTTVAAVIYAFWRLTDISVLVLMACLCNQMRRSVWQVIKRSMTDPNGIINLLCVFFHNCFVLLCNKQFVVGFLFFRILKFSSFCWGTEHQTNATTF